MPKHQTSFSPKTAFTVSQCEQLTHLQTLHVREGSFFCFTVSQIVLWNRETEKRALHSRLNFNFQDFTSLWREWSHYLQNFCRMSWQTNIYTKLTSIKNTKAFFKNVKVFDSKHQHVLKKCGGLFFEKDNYTTLVFPCIKRNKPYKLPIDKDSTKHYISLL